MNSWAVEVNAAVGLELIAAFPPFYFSVKFFSYYPCTHFSDIMLCIMLQDTGNTGCEKGKPRENMLKSTLVMLLGLGPGAGTSQCGSWASSLPCVGQDLHRAVSWGGCVALKM